MDSLTREYEPVRWSIPSDFMTYAHFRRIVEDLDMTSTPGYPYQLSYPTIGRFLGYDGHGSFDENQLAQVYRMVMERVGNRDVDPIRLFIKPEPHKSSKVQKGAWRLISAVSIMDQIVDHMLFDAMNQKMVENYAYIVPQIGWAPLGGGWMTMPTQGVAMDKSGWDWTVKPWLIKVVFELRKRLCNNLTQRWAELAEWRYSALFDKPIFVTSSGDLFQQRQPGVMKSGCVNTISDNSIMQDVLNKVVELETGICSTWMKTMGDDTLQASPGSADQLDRYVQCLRKYCVVKDVKCAVEFAGFRFNVRNIEPLYFAKHCFSLLYASEADSPEIAMSYSLLYHRSRKSGPIKAVCRQLGYVPADAWLDAIWDYE